VTFVTRIDFESMLGLRQTSVECEFVYTEEWPFLVADRVSVNSQLCYLPTAWYLTFLNSLVLLLLHRRGQADL